MATHCIDCAGRVKNRSNSTKRCRACSLIFKKKNARGRTIECFCKLCNKRLSAKKNSTSLCRSCYIKNARPAWNKGMTGLIPWNKGKSIFKNDLERRQRLNYLRRLRYKKYNYLQRMPDRIRTLVRNSLRLRGFRKANTKTTELIGCSIAHLIAHLEQQFTKGMSWGNYGNGYGRWNIDHILPISKFDLSDPEQVKKAFNYRNCRPMWAIENIKKGNH